MAIVRVQGNDRGESTSGATVSITMGSTPTNGNVIVMTYGSSCTTAFRTVSSISQTGVTWTSQTSHSVTMDSYYVVEIWYGIVGSGAATGITVNLSGDIDVNAVANVCEYSGMATSSFLDKTANNSGASVTGDTGTTAVTTQASELWIGCIATERFTQTNPTNGFALLDGVGPGAGAEISLAFLEKIVSAMAAANCSTTNDGFYWIGCIATFKAAVAGGLSIPVAMHHYGHHINKIIRG